MTQLKHMKKKIGSRKFGNIGRCSYVLKKESINAPPAETTILFGLNI